MTAYRAAEQQASHRGMALIRAKGGDQTGWHSPQGQWSEGLTHHENTLFELYPELAPAQPSRAPPARGNVPEIDDLAAVLIIVMIAVFIGTPLLLSLRGRSFAAEKASENSLPLPSELREIGVFRTRYELEVWPRLVTNVESWTDVSVSTSTSGGGSYVVGAHVFTDPVRTSTSVNSTHNRNFFLRRPDGTDGTFKVWNLDFAVAPGQLISIVRAGSKPLMLFNHNTNGFVILEDNLKALHRLPSIAFTLLATVAGCFLLTYALGEHIKSAMEPTPWALVIMVAVVATIAGRIYLGILGLIFGGIRSGQWREYHEPRIKQFLKEAKAAVEEKLAPKPAV
jgi:hypothetical protein